MVDRVHVIMKERPHEGPKIEVKTLKYLATYPDIPFQGYCSTGLIATVDTLSFKDGYKARHLSKPGLHYQSPRKRSSQIKLLKFGNSCDRIHPHRCRPSINVLVAPVYSSSTANPMDHSTLTLNSGVL